MTVREVVAYFNGRVSPAALYAAIERGDIPSIRVGRRILVPTRAIARLFETDESPAQAS